MAEFDDSITIKNFGGIKNAKISLNPLSVFIGPQGSGKSVTAKLFYFSRRTFGDIFDDLNAGKTSKEISAEIKAKFQKYFPPDSLPKRGFLIKYELRKCEADFYGIKQTIGPLEFLIQGGPKAGLRFTIGKLIQAIESIRTTIHRALKAENAPSWVRTEKLEIASSAMFQIGLGRVLRPVGPQLFIPAGRSFFWNIDRSIYSIISSGGTIDPFVAEFGSRLESAKYDKRSNKLNVSQKYVTDTLGKIIGGRFSKDRNGEYLIHDDGRRVPLLYCSSGQQETLPIALILQHLLVRFRAISNAYTIYVEEPEAHLFPTAQKRIVEAIVAAHNMSSPKAQFVITTHSPYVLTSFNNLLQAGQFLRKGVKKKELYSIVPKFEILNPDSVTALLFEDGDVRDILDNETGLISAESLDNISEEIATEFTALLDLE